MKSLHITILFGMAILVLYNLVLAAGQDGMEDPEGPTCRIPEDGSLPTTTEEVRDYIKCCEDAGRLGAFAAAIAACSKLANMCPPPSEDQPTDLEPLSSPPIVDVLELQLQEACRVQSQQTCQNEAFFQTLSEEFTSIYSTSCSDTLQKGPGIIVKGCEDVKAANSIFSEALANICNVTEPLNMTSPGDGRR